MSATKDLDLSFTVLVPIRFRQRERVSQNLQPRLGAFGDDHFHDVEPKQNVGIIQQPQPSERAAGNAVLFLAIHRLDRPPEVLARPRFHLDENERVAIAADHVDLAAGAPLEITIQNSVAVPLQEPAGQVLPLRPKSQMRGPRNRKAAAPPVRKIVDESDKARVHAV